MRIVMVMSSTFDPPEGQAARTAQLRAFAAPYYRFLDAGLDVTLTSPLGGAPPIAWPPPADATDPVVARYRQDRDARDLLSDTLPLAAVYPEDFDLAFYPGDCPGNVAAMAELAADPASRALIAALWPGAPLAFVGSATAALLDLVDARGAPLVRGRRVTGATRGEQRTLASFAPDATLLEDDLRERGALYSQRPDWTRHVVEDGRLVTGQNAASADEAACVVLRMANAPKA